MLGSISSPQGVPDTPLNLDHGQDSSFPNRNGS
jgi:hypothetical protein